MDKISVWSVFFVSFPEELLTVLITLTGAGYRDVLNFKSRDKVFKLLISTSLMIISALIIGLFFSFSLKLVLNSAIFFLIIISVYRFKPVYCIFSFLLSLIVIMGSEIIFFPLFMSLTNLSYQQISDSTIYMILFSLPSRIIQLTTFIVICKARKLSLKTYKLLPADITIIVMYFLTLISNFLFIEKNYIILQTADLTSRLKFIVSITIGIVFSLWLIFYLLKLRQKLLLRENIHDVELHHIRQLISEGKTDYAIQLIDSTLNDRGYYNNQ